MIARLLTVLGVKAPGTVYDQHCQELIMARYRRVQW